MLKKFKFANSTYSISFLLNGSFQSELVEVYRHDGSSVADKGSFLGRFHRDHQGLLISSYNVYGLPLNFFTLDFCSEFVGSTRDYLIPMFKSTHHESFDIKEFNALGNGWIVKTALYRGLHYVDVSEEIASDFYDQQFVVRGFFGSNDEGYFYSPLIGHVDNQPKTWLRLNNHKVKIVEQPSSFGP